MLLSEVDQKAAAITFGTVHEKIALRLYTNALGLNRYN